MVYVGDPWIRDIINKNMRNCNFIWMVLLGVTLIIGILSRFVLNFVHLPANGWDKDTLRMLYYALLFISVLEIGVIFVLKKVLMRPMYRLGEFPSEPQAQEQYITSLFKFYTPMVAVCAACGVSVAIYGLILLFMGASFNNVVPFFVLSIAGLLVARPTIGDIESVLNQS